MRTPLHPNKVWAVLSYERRALLTTEEPPVIAPLNTVGVHRTTSLLSPRGRTRRRSTPSFLRRTKLEQHRDPPAVSRRRHGTFKAICRLPSSGVCTEISGGHFALRACVLPQIRMAVYFGTVFAMKLQRQDEAIQNSLSVLT